MLKRIILYAIAALVLMFVSLGLYFQEELTRLNVVLTMFELENISENFKSFPTFVNTAVVQKSISPVPLPQAESWSLPESFQLGDSTVETQAFFDHTNTDGFLIYQGDSIRYIYYGNGFTENDIHISWSMSKSLISGLIGIALEDGKIRSIEQLATEYVPELAGSGYEGVTIKNLLQMSSGIRFNEDYGDFDSDINRMGRYFALGMPMADFAASLTNGREPGTYNHYVSIDTQVLGMVLVSATGMSIAEYSKVKIWDAIGAEADAHWIVDNAEMEFALGGYNATLRDYAKLGKLYLDSGRWNGTQLIPEAWVLDSTRPLDTHVQMRVEDGIEKDGYGYQWWIPFGSDDEFMAIGVYDQFIYIDPDKDAFIVKLSSNHHFRDDYTRLYKRLSIALFKEILEK
ncbi:MAG: serine hydrolase [Ekhidna sp.]|nr:serine hydrolase [Ekhidna sp.]